MEVFKIGLAQINGQRTWGGFDIDLANRDREVIFRGSIDYGAAADLGLVLDDNPDVELIHLFSDGGSVTEAQAIARVITARELNTYTANTCSSACTIAFVAGLERFIAANGRLGFHTTSIKGAASPNGEALNAAMREAYLAKGVDKDFIQKALSYPPEDMWYPSHEELLKAGVVDVVVDPAYYASDKSIHAMDKTVIASELDKHELFQILKVRDPSLYEEAVQQLEHGLRNRLPIVQIQQSLRRNVTSQVIRKYLSKAPTEELEAYYQVAYAQTLHLANEDMELCAKFVAPSGSVEPLNATSALPSDLIERDMEKLVTALTAALSRPVATDFDEAETKFFEILEQVYEENSEYIAALSEPESYKDSPKTICLANLRLLQIILSPEFSEFRGAVLRFLSENR